MDGNAPVALARRAGTFAPATFNADARTVEVVWTTGARVQRTDWWSGERWMEELEVSERAVDLSRLNGGAPLLNSHSAGQLSDVIGVVERAWIKDGEGRAVVRFSDREDVAPILRDVQAGIIRNISAGYWVQEWRDVSGGDDKIPVRRAVRWMPGEISLVPVPADAGAQVRAAGDIQADLKAAVDAISRAISDQPAAPAASQEQTMADNAPAAAPEAPAADVRSAPIAEPSAPRPASLAEIKALAQRAGLDDSFVVRQLEAGATVDAARDAVIDALAASRSKPPQSSGVRVLRDEGDTLRRGMEGWLLHRLDPQRYKLENEATACRGMSLLDMARASLEAGGHSVRGFTPAEIARAALGLQVRGFAIRGGGTTSDFPNLLANTQQKRLLAAYDGEDRNFTAWARRRDLPDFKLARTIELGAAPALRALQEGGNIEFGQMGEGGETWNLTRFARNVALSYPAIVNDDLGGFDRVPVAFANAAANLELTTVYGILNSNPAMSDGANLFSSARTITVDGSSVTQSNTTSGALSVDNFQALRTLILRMRDATGQQTRVLPNVLLVPPEIEMTALALFSTVVVPAGVATTQVNPYRGSVSVVSSQFLTDANDWFLTVSSGTGYEAVEYGYETGMSGPELTSYTDPEVDGLAFSCRHSFGAKAVTFRTIARSAN